MKILKIMVVLMLLLCAYAYAATESGTCGDNLTWELTDGVLTISGTGAMNSYSYGYPIGTRSPWAGKSAITSVTINNGVTDIGSYAFDGCSNLTSVRIPDSVTSVGTGAFRYCSSLKTIRVSSLAQWLRYDHNSSELYLRDSSGKLYIGSKVLAGELTLPDGITSLDKGAFRGCSSLTGITIPDSVTTIGDSVFQGCTGLTEMAIPDSVTSIGNDVFKGCKNLTSITIPDSVTSIGEGAFYGCSSLPSITIPPYITSVADYVFCNCSSLTTVIIPDGVTSIGAHAFWGCSGLTGVTIPHGVTSIGTYAFGLCSSLKSFTVPDGMKYLFDGVFRDCVSLKEITIPDSVISVGATFYGCSNLETVTIPVSVTKIYDYAFKDCSSLATVNYGGSVTDKAKISIGNYNTALTNATWNYEAVKSGSCGKNAKWTLTDGKLTISGTGDMNDYSKQAFSPWNQFTGVITSVTIEKGITHIGAYAFYECKNLTSVTIPDSVESVGSFAFSGCASLTKAVLPDGVSSVGEYAFYGCSSLKTLALPDGVTSVSRGAFYNCSGLTAVTIPDTVTAIGPSAFMNCSRLEEITLPDGVTDIEASAFYGCGGLTTVTIPESLKSIGNYAFYGCGSLTTVNYGGGVADRAYISIGSNNTALTTAAWVYGILTSGTCGDKAVWKLLDGVLTISGGGDMKNWSASTSAPWHDYAADITDVKIGIGITSIGNYAFYGCVNVKAITIPARITSVGSGAFRGCSGLTAVTIPDSVTIIGDFAFDGCGSLEAVTIPAGVTKAGNKAFRNCTGLTAITIPDSVTSLGDSAFYGCSGLQTAKIGTGVTSVGDNTFRECGSLETVTIPLSVTSLGNKAFYGCGSLATVIYGGSRADREQMSFGSYNTSLTGAVWIYTSLTSGTCGENLAWQLEDGELTIGGTGDMYTYVDSSLTPWYGYKIEIYAVTIAEGVTTVSCYAFSDCRNLTTVSIADSVTYIGHSAFSGCEQLRTVTIPDSVTYIGDSAFSACGNLTDVYYSGDSAQKNRISIGSDNERLATATWHLRNYGSCGENVTWRINSDLELYISGTGAMYAYARGEQPWASGAYSIVTVQEGVTELTANAFYGAEITRIYLPESVSVFGDDIVSCSPVIYCYEYSIADDWASLNGFETVYIDGQSYDDYASITISEDAVIYRTETHKFEAVTVPASAAGAVTWTTSDAEVATVDETGLATAHSAGTATITASIGSKTACATLTVQGFAEVGKLTIEGAPESLLAGEPVKLRVISDPHDDSLVYTWSSSDETVLTVTQDGEIAVAGKGTARVTVTAEGVTATTEDIVCDIHAKAITLPEVWCVAKISAEIPCAIEPANASVSLTWTAVHSKNATVTIDDGILYSMVPGDVTVTVTDSVSGLSAQSVAHVCYPVTAVILPEELTIGSDSWQFECTCVTRGGNYGNGLVTYTADNDEVAIITESGLLTAVKPGTVNVTATAIGGQSAVCAVTIAKSGTCGKDLTWTLANGALEISGTGGMTGWSSAAAVPWYEYIAGITSVTINDGVTSIGNQAFRNCAGLEEVSIPASVVTVGSKAFYGCESLATVIYGGSRADRESMTIGSGNTALKGAAWVYTCGNIHYCADGICVGCGRSFDLSGLDTLTLPEGLKSIGAGAFSGTAAQVIIVPDGCENIEDGAFEGFDGYISLPAGLECEVPEGAVVIYRG